MHEAWDGLSDERKDWHPGSHQQVWDLVHPSLHCLVRGRTRVVDGPIALQDALASQGTGEGLTARQWSRVTAELRFGHVRNRSSQHDPWGPVARPASPRRPAG